MTTDGQVVGEPGKNIIIHIYFKSGNHVAIPVESWQYTKLLNGTKTLKWNQDGMDFTQVPRLAMICIAEVEAILEEREPTS